MVADNLISNFMKNPLQHFELILFISFLSARANYYAYDVLFTSLSGSSFEHGSFCIQVRHSNNYAVSIDS